MLLLCISLNSNLPFMPLGVVAKFWVQDMMEADFNYFNSLVRMNRFMYTVLNNKETLQSPAKLPLNPTDQKSCLHTETPTFLKYRCEKDMTFQGISIQPLFKGHR